MKKVRKKGLSGATAVVTPLIFYCPLEHSANAKVFVWNDSETLVPVCDVEIVK